MFCGIVHHVGVIERVSSTLSSVLLRIRSQFDDFELGESIAVDGICLTVTAYDQLLFDCELSSETLKQTIAKTYRPGQLVNLERAMRLGDRMGGHFVTGHVDQTIFVEDKKIQDGFICLRFSGFLTFAQAYLIVKGSVTINGVSLTVNDVDRRGFSVMLIPHTLDQTNLSTLKINDSVNVEWDYIAKLMGKQAILNRDYDERVKNGCLDQKEGA